MKVNIKTVAAKSGVSISTVSRVFNNPSLVSKDTLEKVSKAVRELGYHQNLVASNLRKKHTDYVGLVLPDSSDEYYASLFKILEKELRESSLYLHLCNSDANGELEKQHLQYLIDSKVCALVLVATDIENNWSLLQELSIPIILFDHFDPLLNQKENVVCIESDQIAGIQNATEVIIKNGAKRILFLHQNRQSRTTEQQKKGFFKALEENGIPVSYSKILDTHPNPFFTAEHIKEVYIEYKFDGLICSSDSIAIGALKGLREMGVKIPYEVQVVGFDGLDFCNFTVPTLSTIRRDVSRLGSVVTQKIAKMIHDVHPFEHIVVPTQFLERFSTINTG